MGLFSKKKKEQLPPAEVRPAKVPEPVRILNPAPPKRMTEEQAKAFAKALSQYMKFGDED